MRCLVVFVLFALSVNSAEPLRIWMNVDTGKSFRAQLVSVNVDQTVTLQGDGEPVKLALAKLRNDDLKYIAGFLKQLYAAMDAEYRRREADENRRRKADEGEAPRAGLFD